MAEIKIVVSQEDKAEIVGAAKRLSLSLAAFVRMAALAMARDGK